MLRIEVIFWSVGIALILFFCGAHAWGGMERQRDIATFYRAQQLNSIPNPAAGLFPASSGAADSTMPMYPPSAEAVLAILRIPGLEFEVPVNYGTDEQVLLRGAGVIEGTSLPGSNGNVAIAAHRDTHFRALKDISVGDVIELETPDRTQTYIVTGLTIVEPTDVQVLDETGESVLTLVTCYPFYFVGHAPQRFIVRAEAAGNSI